MLKTCLLLTGILFGIIAGKKNWETICKRTLKRYIAKCLVEDAVRPKGDICGSRVPDEKLKARTIRMCRRTEKRTFSKCNKSCEPVEEKYYPVSEWYDVVPWKNMDIDIKKHPLEIRSEGIVSTWKYINFQLIGPTTGEPPFVSVAIKDNWVTLSGIKDCS